MKNVLVTGASGFIGNNVLEMFRINGDNVLGWDLFSSNLKCREINMLDIEEVKKGLKSFQPDLIIHCAGLADVRKSVEEPLNDYDSNVTVTHNLFFALLAGKINNCRIIFLSSAAVYGNPERLPITEDSVLNPLSPYALHKIMCEDICSYFKSHYSFDVKIVRIFSAYGNGLKKQLLWDMVNKAKQTGELNMFGTGNESRDYIHIDDLVFAIKLISESSSKKEFIYNIANGEEVTIRTIVNLFAKYSGIKNVSFNGVIRDGEPLNWCADISKLKDLGYSKKVDIEDGIEKYVLWSRND